MPIMRDNLEWRNSYIRGCIGLPAMTTSSFLLPQKSNPQSNLTAPKIHHPVSFAEAAGHISGRRESLPRTLQRSVPYEASVP